MAKRNNGWAWLLVAIIGVAFQVAFVFADCRQTATGTAIDFSKAYFLLDADMQKFVCGELAGDEDESPVTGFLQAMADKAHAQGYEIGMLRQSIYHVETETLAQDGEAATIHLKGLSRTSINPLYFYVAKLFRLGKTHTFEETLELVKEDGSWKVCGTPYGLDV